MFLPIFPDKCDKDNEQTISYLVINEVVCAFFWAFLRLFYISAINRIFFKEFSFYFLD